MEPGSGLNADYRALAVVLRGRIFLECTGATEHYPGAPVKKKTFLNGTPSVLDAYNVQS